MNVTNVMLAEHSNNHNSLSAEFNKAEILFHEIENSSLSPTDPQYRSRLQLAIRQCELVWELVQRADLVSKNEDIDDVTTFSLRYLIIPYYVGILYTKVSKSEERLSALQQAQKIFRSFLNLCDQLRLLHPNDVRYYHAVLKEETNSGDVPWDAQTIRAMKIERFKRLKETKLKLEELRAQTTSNQTVAPTDSTLSRKKPPDESNGMEDGDEDESLLREVRLLQLKIAACTALDELALVLQEIPLLQRAQQQSQRPTEPTKAVEAPAQRDRPLVATKIASVNGRLVATPLVLSPSASDTAPALPVAVASRLQMQQEVFRPGWPQPTLTVEQAAEIEMQFRAKGDATSSSGSSPATANATSKESSEPTSGRDKEKATKSDDEDAPDYDAHGVYKKREWDDWKDDNPTGWGNTGNKGYVY
jgi:immunoglobulin-binding protein 1